MNIRHKTLKTILLGTICLISGIMESSCNKDDNESLDPLTVPQVAVTAFKLKADRKVMEGLDSVFFSIDLNNGVIFNADSLPKGSDVRKLVPVITYSNTVTQALIETVGGLRSDTTINYLSNPTDSIDFTGRVTLTLGSGSLQKTYRLKVNVHQTDPDSLVWDEVASTRLPASMAEPRSQKTVKVNDKAICFIEENDGSIRAIKFEDIFTPETTSFPTGLNAGTQLETMAVTDDNILYVLDSDNHLLKSDSEGMRWSDTGKTWVAVTGAYGNTVIGIENRDGRLWHTHYPSGTTISDSPLEDGFPVKEHSRMQPMSNNWATQPVTFITGGRTADGNLTNAVWAFDGDSWANIAKGPMPAMAGMEVVGYYSYRKTSAAWIQKELPTWIAFGGMKADGTINRTVYVSHDNGIVWREAPSLMQLPPEIPALIGADCLIFHTPKNANIADAWTKSASPGKKIVRKISYEIDGYDIRWQCPYIFFFGGYDISGHLQQDIWRAVLARLTYAPVF